MGHKGLAQNNLFEITCLELDMQHALFSNIGNLASINQLCPFDCEQYAANCNLEIWNHRLVSDLAPELVELVVGFLVNLAVEATLAEDGLEVQFVSNWDRY